MRCIERGGPGIGTAAQTSAELDEYRTAGSGELGAAGGGDAPVVSGSAAGVATAEAIAFDSKLTVGGNTYERTNHAAAPTNATTGNSTATADTKIRLRGRSVVDISSTS